MVIRPVLLRPPLPRRPSLNDLTGLPFHSPLRSTMTRCRLEGVVGLKVFNTIASYPCCHIDPLTRAKGNERLLVIRTASDTPAKALQLTGNAHCVNRGHLDIEQRFYGCPDLTLCGTKRYTKDHLVMFGNIRGLFGNDRRANDVEHLLASRHRRDARDYTKPAHFRRASICRTASRVRTSTSRRKMS